MTFHGTLAAAWTSPAEVHAWKRQAVLTALLLLAILLTLARIPTGSHAVYPLYQVQTQDAVPLLILAVSLMVAAFWTPSWRLPAHVPDTRLLAAIGISVVGLLAYGTRALMNDFPLSIDERMVLFDMAVFERLQFATPFPESWRPYTEALHPAFLLNQNMPTGLVSSYLPMNAFLRMAFSEIADPVFFNPLLALAGGAALFDIALRSFRNDVAACWVVLLTYVLSAQMLVNAMTVYAMTGHMALNLIWLAAFLRGGRWGHAAAILTGFVATGLHQLAFHPFFVAPFLLWRLRQGEWKLVLLYGAAYLGIVLWWMAYPLLAAPHVASVGQAAPNSDFLERIKDAFAAYRDDTVFTMLFNLLRFFAWQNLALPPLLWAAVAVAIRDRGLPAALLSGIALWLAFIALVLPFQGHGWGYRYAHPYLGSFALLAGYGYQQLRTLLGRKADGLVLALSGVTLLLTIPLLFMAAHRFVAPYVAVEQLVAAQRTRFVLIDTHPRRTDGRTGNAVENVRNRPDLSNRPLRLSSRAMTPELFAKLCRLGPIATIGMDDQHSVGFALKNSGGTPGFTQLVQQVQKDHPGCLVPAKVLASRGKQGRP